MSLDNMARSVAGRLSLRAPQTESLARLARAIEAAPAMLRHDRAADEVAAVLDLLKAQFPKLQDFEREFPSLCFALATGVGKTRLMGAFIAYLYKAHGIKHFFVLAPNLTIYDNVDGLDPADIFIATTAGRAFGLIQRYRFDDNPQYLDELAPLLSVPSPALSIDYLVGPPADLGRGLGTAMIRTALASTWRDYADAPCVVVPVCVANIASWKALERAGFRRVAEGLLAPDNPIDPWDHYVYRIARA